MRKQFAYYFLLNKFMSKNKPWINCQNSDSFFSTILFERGFNYIFILSSYLKLSLSVDRTELGKWLDKKI